MYLYSIKTIKDLLLKYNTHPSKIMGQNFLIDKPTLDKIIKTADMSRKDTILEIGPGIGTLTQELSKNAGKVIAIEKDKVMVEILKETLHDFNNIEIVQGNILKFSIFNFQFSNYKVVANIPYYLTSPIIRKFLEAENPHDQKIGAGANKPDEIILMVQKEVAQRICAKPPRMSILAVSVQFYAEAKIISYVSKECFWPAPKVDSAIIKITPHSFSSLRATAKQSNNSTVSAETFFKIVKAGFLHPRKQLANNLSKTLKKGREEINTWLLKNNIKPTQRAETLNIQDWINLTNTMNF